MQNFTTRLQKGIMRSDDERGDNEVAAEPSNARKDCGADKAAKRLADEDTADKDTADEDTVNSKKGGSRIIGRLLPPAVSFWLRSQVDQVASLTIDLTGRDLQILTGYLPGAAVSASHAVYKGIHLSQAQLSAVGIQINVGEVIRGKPLRLLQPFPVLGSVVLSAEDLEASLISPLLMAGLLSFWRSLMQIPDVAEAVKARYGLLPTASDMVLARPQIRLGIQCLCLSFYPSRLGEEAPEPVILGTKLSIVDKHFLQLSSPTWLPSLEGFSATALGSLEDSLKADLPDGLLEGGSVIEVLDGFRWNLGADTRLSELTIEPSRLLCRGQLSVRP
ncbi:MAG: DUF2993 domain-containing protein [Phormidesmis sp.]